MAINRTQFTAENRVVREIARQRRAGEGMKQTQYVGADSIRMAAGDTALGIVNLPAGNVADFRITFTPSKPILTSVDLYASVFVDNNLNQNYIYPDGASLSAGQQLLRQSLVPSWGHSSDSTGVRVFIFTIENMDSNAHTYYIAFCPYAPELLASTGV